MTNFYKNGCHWHSEILQFTFCSHVINAYNFGMKFLLLRAFPVPSLITNTCSSLSLSPKRSSTLYFCENFFQDLGTYILHTYHLEGKEYSVMREKSRYGSMMENNISKFKIIAWHVKCWQVKWRKRECIMETVDGVLLFIEYVGGLENKVTFEQKP